VHVPYANLSDQLVAGGLLFELGRASGKRLVFYCAFGERSAMAVETARDAGLSSACHLKGGVNSWKKAGGPLIPA
jgi:sulfur dioxygenase